MAKQIKCECGKAVRGETDEEVIAGAREHIRQDHPELVESVSREVLVGWIEEV